MSLAKWREELLTREKKYIWQVGVGLFGCWLGLFFCLGVSTERGPKPFGMYLFIVAVCLVCGYVFGKLTWRWNLWFSKLNRVIDHYEATHPDIARGGPSAEPDHETPQG
jgi:hypothetical protein